MPDDPTESVGYTKVKAAAITHVQDCRPQLHPLCSAALLPKFMTQKSGMKAKVSLETMIEPHDLVCNLRLKPMHL